MAEQRDTEQVTGPALIVDFCNVRSTNELVQSS